MNRESLETTCNKTLFCWRRIYSKTTKIRTIYSSNGNTYSIFFRKILNKSFQALRFTKAHVTHPELKATFQLPIIGVKKNPSSPLYTSLGVITKGTVLEVSILIILKKKTQY